MRKTVFCFCFFIFLSLLHAGDIANFVNLGFSADGNYFAFGQHGVTDEKYQGYAEIFCIDVRENKFVPSGHFKVSPTVETVVKDSKNIFFSLLDRASNLLSKWEINQKYEGRPIYVLNNDNLNEKTLIFRDFETNDEYTVVLHKEKKSSLEASFYLSIEITKPNGTKITKEAGQKGKTRAGVKDYAVKKVIIDKTNTSLVFIIEKHMYDQSGTSIRYMAETVKM